MWVFVVFTLFHIGYICAQLTQAARAPAPPVVNDAIPLETIPPAYSHSSSRECYPGVARSRSRSPENEHRSDRAETGPSAPPAYTETLPL